MALALLATTRDGDSNDLFPRDFAHNVDVGRLDAKAEVKLVIGGCENKGIGDAGSTADFRML